MRANILVLIVFLLSGCVSNYVAPDGDKISKIRFIMSPSGTKNSIKVYDEYEDCSGMKNVIHLSDATEETISVRSNEKVSISVFQVVSVSYGWQTSKSQYCEYTFTFLPINDEYLVKTLSNDRCSILVSSIENGVTSPVDIKIRKYKDNILDSPALSHCD